MWNRFLHKLPAGVLAAALFIAAGTSTAAEAEQHTQIVDGVAIYLGILPAEMVRGHPKEPAAMHGGSPTSPRARHVVVALFDSKSGQRITDAKVKARVGELGLAVAEKPLESMTVAGATTYGNYFPMSGPGPYRIEVEIRRPGTESPIQARFEYRHAGR